MIWELDEFMVHTVTVETQSGATGWGDTYTAVSEPIPCFVDDTTRLTRDPAGAEVVSTATVYTHPDHAGLFTPGSQVRLPSRVATVVTVNARTSGQLDLPDHVEVTLT